MPVMSVVPAVPGIPSPAVTHELIDNVAVPGVVAVPGSDVAAIMAAVKPGDVGTAKAVESAEVAGAEVSAAVTSATVIAPP